MLYLAEFYLPAGEVFLAELAGTAGFVLAIHVPADETCFALYHAHSAEAVMAAGERAGIAFERVAAAILRTS